MSRAANPIQHHETLHQQRSGRRLPIRERWLIAGMLVIVVLLLLIPDDGVLDFPIPLWVLWIFHSIVAFRLVLAGLNTISREHTAQTWEALILTGVSARQIFMGKWRAVLWRMRAWPISLTRHDCVTRCAMQRTSYPRRMHATLALSSLRHS